MCASHPPHHVLSRYLCLEPYTVGYAQSVHILCACPCCLPVRCLCPSGYEELRRYASRHEPSPVAGVSLSRLSHFAYWSHPRPGSPQSCPYASRRGVSRGMPQLCDMDMVSCHAIPSSYNDSVILYGLAIFARLARHYHLHLRLHLLPHHSAGHDIIPYGSCRHYPHHYRAACQQPVSSPCQHCHPNGYGESHQRDIHPGSRLYIVGYQNASHDEYGVSHHRHGL